jgi:hypothetical protein
MSPTRALRRGVAAAALVGTLLAACSSGSEGDKAGGDASAPTGAEPSEFPEGVYRAVVPAEYLIEKDMDSQTAHDLGGIWTLTIKDGRWRGHTQSALNHPDCGGTYSVKAGRFSLRDDQCGVSHVVMTARWKLEDGELTFFDIRVGRPLEWGSKPFKRIG